MPKRELLRRTIERSDQIIQHISPYQDDRIVGRRHGQRPKDEPLKFQIRHVNCPGLRSAIGVFDDNLINLPQAQRLGRWFRNDTLIRPGIEQAFHAALLAVPRQTHIHVGARMDVGQ